MSSLIWVYICLGNKRVSQMWVILEACRKLAGDYNRLPEVLYFFCTYTLIHAPYIRIVVFWHISN